jgi:hypothetical protein
MRDDFMVTHFSLTRSGHHLCISTITPKSGVRILVRLGASREELQGHGGTDNHDHCRYE